MSPNGWIVLRGASGNNLRAIDVAIPRGLFTCVSGSGKSTLVQDTLGLHPDEIGTRLMYEVYGTRTTWAAHDSLEGFEGIDKVIDIDQSPIGRTPRSNPATYTGTPDFAGIRKLRHDPRLPRLVGELFAMTPDPDDWDGCKNGRFSFSKVEDLRSRPSRNVKGGRCKACRNQRQPHPVL